MMDQDHIQNFAVVPIKLSYLLMEDFNLTQVSMQVYLVTGGILFSNRARATTYLDSTETMVSEENGWKIIQKSSLPRPMAYFQGISMQNKIIMLGRVHLMSTSFLA